MRFLQREWPVVFAAVVLGLAWLLSSWWSRAEAPPKGERLAGFPLELGNRWQGSERSVPEYERRVLRASEVMLRGYSWVGGATAPDSPSLSEQAPGEQAQLPPVVLYVGYYHSQRTGATYHSPQHCLPGGGWQITELRRVPVMGPHEREVTVNEVVIQKGLRRQLMLYWYQDRGRIVASEYWAKAYMVWDSLTQNRSDGALVRVSVDVTGDLAPARAHMHRFVQDMWQPLTRVLPGAGSRQTPGANVTAVAISGQRRAN